MLLKTPLPKLIIWDIYSVREKKKKIYRAFDYLLKVNNPGSK